MFHSDVLIVGGGPAGSACAWRLKQAGAACIIVDKQSFPRFKPCAGWITPRVLEDLQIQPEEYPHGIKTFDALHIRLYGIPLKIRTRQYAIRRVEFDQWLLRRSGADFHVHTVRKIEQTSHGYVIDDEYQVKYLVGAGGTACPVYHSLFKPYHPRQSEHQIVALEAEFPYAYTDERCYLWFMENGLSGYSWYVPKAGGVLNVGVGGMSERLRGKNDSIQRHWDWLVTKLNQLGLLKDGCPAPFAHTYYLRQRELAAQRDNAYLVGDSAGLATLDMGEGIGPAIQSGLRAAEAILSGTPYILDGIPRYSTRAILFPSRHRRA